jgi:hypothetical protein
VATPTAVIFRGEHKVLPSEQDAYVWLINQFLRYKPDLLTNSKSGPHLCKGRRGADLFAGAKQKMTGTHSQLISLTTGPKFQKSSQIAIGRCRRVKAEWDKLPTRRISR